MPTSELIKAIEENHLDDVTLLLAGGADLNVRDEAGLNAMDIALQLHQELLPPPCS